MRESLKLACGEFISARDALKGIFRMENDQMYPVCASMFISAGRTPDEAGLRAARTLVRSSVGIFSSFRGTVEFPLVSMLACSEDPYEKWERTQAAYACLRERFFASEYLAMAALLISDAEEDYYEIADRGKTLYRRMRSEHPFLTGSEDSVFALLLARSGRSNDELIADMEASYRILGTRFTKGEGLQSVTHVLALDDAEPSEKSDRFTEIYDEIIRLGGKYGKDARLSTLAALSLTGEDPKKLAADIMDADSFLAEQKGYRSIFGMDARTRTMHAAMIVSSDVFPGNCLVNAAAGRAAVVMIAAQQAAMCAVMAGTAAASSTH